MEKDNEVTSQGLTGGSPPPDGATAAGYDGSLEKPRWKIVGPGLIVAATGIGAGDLVATMVAGSAYGYALLWAVILGVVIKIVLVEGAGRWTLATGRTIFDGWKSLGLWAVVYFGIYVVIWGFSYGAAAMSGVGLALNGLFPGVDLRYWAMLAGVAGLLLVWFGKYKPFENVMAVLIGVMFVTVVGSAILTTPNLGEIAAGLVPIIPEGAVLNTLGLAGGVGGTITLAAYGYWLTEKGWSTPRWMRVMRLDNVWAYVMSGVFVVSMLIVGAELLFSAGLTVADGEEGLIDVADVLSQRYGSFMAPLFLVGFFAATFSSILGVWHGVSLMFADFVATMRNLPSDDRRRGAGGTYYRAYILWLTFPPMALLFLDRPILLVVLYGALGSLFMPFLALTLLILMNSKAVPLRWRNRWWVNVILVLVAAMFLFLGGTELIKAVAPLFGG
ncbi:Mn2+ and Fe2+ transporters of the NRAMP family [Promicromonospora umidemergens]|uniref:Nramp family divalent metal transporter n=1 Tax=Promicromonospora umidemergens TaxID=629679 RepID=A0ABP8YCF9_9MICO|nr:Nramp family divalent metal transporter [Promicromonospora umidemergens]MCP2284680.1 Mn2+ and Fe2+ transporters of the NRAMP family [Promicromonospora umidemergens]